MNVFTIGNKVGYIGSILWYALQPMGKKHFVGNPASF